MLLKSKLSAAVYFSAGYENKNGIVSSFLSICIGLGNDFSDCHLDKAKGNKYFALADLKPSVRYRFV